MSDSGSLLRWLLALELLGWGLYPLLYLAVPGLRDRGLTLAKPFALLLFVYPVWFIAALGLPLFTAPALIAVGTLLAVTGWGFALRQHGIISVAGATPVDPAARRIPPTLFDFLRGSWRYVILSEAIFIGGFLFYAWLRSYNPQILGTEKPMEIGFLSAATRDTALPPRDPWLSGYGINYYYLGFVLVAALAKVTAISSSIAFNLGLATVFALALSGGAGTLANLVAVARDNGRQLPRASTLAIGLLGGYLLVFAGNMYAARDLLERGRAAIDTWWWGGLGWKSSRVVVDSGFPGWVFGPNAAPSETITEFPFFSFILGDLHAHVLALPFTLLALALALDIFLAPIFGAGRETPGGGRALPPGAGALARLALAALVIGGLYAINSWDLPTYAVIYLAAGALPILAAGRRLGRREWLAAAGFAIACFALYLPFHARFTSLVGGQPFDLPEPLASVPLLPQLSSILGVVIWGKTPATQFFTVYLLPWVAGLLFLTWRWHEGRKGTKDTPEGGYTRPILIVLGLALVATIVRMPVLFLAGAILLLAGAIYRQRRLERVDPPALADADLFAVALFAAAFGLVLMTEILFIHDVFGNRMNTIFKVYYQAWTILAVGAGYAIVRVLSFRPQFRADRWRIPAAAALALLLLATTAYPIFGARARTEEFSTRGSLDGLEFVRQAQPEEWRGITWVRENVPAGAVVAEAPGCSYGELSGMPHNRVSTFAGVSTPLGWGGHESQWRGGSPALVAALGPRGEDINRLYSTTDPAEAVLLLDRYAIEYVYVGLFERVGYGGGGIGADCRAGGGYPQAGLAKFDALMDRAYATPGGTVVIYKRR
ncbi:MAG: FIG01021662: hypothetical protein [uncultured Thermomicrobiales bacterium]|uniref:Uncharacterized protein n=1 Tax=uncultured Thermomicrobiales bacterium TaxID=1645740 RepID=A0A6J4UDW1_9BACT|nr:MAG: FIG01021662: hypothetical protein [uncultured Thermomicrobiales bacterium]